MLKRTKTGPSTDARVLEELAAQGHRVPVLLMEYREMEKLRGTYVDALPRMVNPRTGRIHTSFNQSVAATGRLSSADPNLQNIPIRTELGRQIRRAFIPAPGMKMLSADYSQVELRILAHLSGDKVLTEAFHAGEDIHTRTALEVFGVLPGTVTDDMRRMAKAVNFGVVYGLSPFGLSQNIGVPVEEARRFIDGYFERYAGVRAYIDRTLAEKAYGAPAAPATSDERHEIHAFAAIGTKHGDVVAVACRIVTKPGIGIAIETRRTALRTAIALCGCRSAPLACEGV